MSLAPVGVQEALSQLLAPDSEPVREVFVTRALNALADLAPRLSPAELVDAVSAPTDLAVLVSALRSPEALESLHEVDPLAGARLRGVQAREQLLQAEGGTLGVDEVARLLHLTRQGVDRRRRKHALLAVEAGKRGYRYPAWQLAGEGVLDGLLQTLRALEVAPWSQLAWFLSGDVRLGGERPLDVLRRGEVERVVCAAGAYGMHAAA